MSANVPKIHLYSNNPEITDYFLSLKADVHNLLFTESKNAYYTLLILDLSSDLTDLTSKILNYSDTALKQNQKILFCFLQESNQNPETLNRYQSLITDLKESKLDYRSLTVIDLYTLNLDKPVTSFDKRVEKWLDYGTCVASSKSEPQYYPLEVKSFLEAVKKILYLNSTSLKKYYLSGIGISDIDNAYIVKKYYEEYFRKDFDIETNKDVSSNPFFLKQVATTEAELDLKTDSSYFDNLKEHISAKSKEKKIDLEKISQNKKKVPFILKKINKIKSYFDTDNQKKSNLSLNHWAIHTIEKNLLRILLLASLIFLVSSFLFIGGSYYALKSLESAHFYLKKGDISKTNYYFKRSDVAHKVSSYNFSFVVPVIQIINPQIALQSQKIISFINFTDTVFENVIQTYSISEKTYNSLNTAHNLNYESIFLGLKTNFQQIYESLNQLEILINDKDLPKPLTDAIKNNQEFKDLSKIKENLWEASKILEVIPNLLGESKNSNVFFVIQNNSEIRGTGGVIDYIYHLSIERGRLIFIKEYTPQEIAELSDQSILPPPLVEKVTGSQVWSLRDMNYNPDFPQTAVNIAWYLENKLKTKPDFIVGLNASSLIAFLENSKIQNALGNKYSLNDYKNSLNGGTSPQTTKNIFNDLVKIVFEKQMPALEMFDVLLSESENISLWSSDENLQSLIYNQPLSKAINKKSCLPGMSSARICHQETIHLNYSNFSSIPLNNYTNKELYLKITPQALSVDHSLEVKTSYQQKTPLINRNLVEIVQFYVNKESKITKIEIDAQLLNLDQVQVQTEGELSRYQFISSTPLNKETILKIEYSTPMPQRTVLPIAYSYSIIPQPGIKFSKKNLEILLPQNSRVSAITSPAQSEPDSLVVNLSDKNSFGFNLVAR